MSKDKVLAAPIDPAIHTFILDDECVLFSPARQEIHVLNTCAAVIWCHLLNGESPSGMVAKLRDDFAVSPEDSVAFVATALEDWRRRGFMVDCEPRPAVMSQATRQEQVRLDYEPIFVTERYYALLGWEFRIRFTSAEQVTFIHPFLAHLESGGPNFRSQLDIVQAEDRLVLYRNKAMCGACGALNELAPLVNGVVWTTAVNHHDFFIGIHAGVVAGPAGALLLPGNPGSGKSSLTAALTSAGFEYFSDEIALLRDSDFCVYPVPLSLCIKDTGLDILASRFPEIRRLPIHKRADGKRVSYLPPPADSITSPGSARSVQAIIFPRYVAGSQTLCSSMPKATALQLLMDQCLVVHKKLNAQRVRALVEWIRNVPCHELVFSSLDAAILAVTNVSSDGRV